MAKKYYKCSVETDTEYKSAGFIVRDDTDPVDKIVKFFKDHPRIKYDGVYCPLKECTEADLKNCNFVYRECLLFGWVLE